MHDRIFVIFGLDGINKEHPDIIPNMILELMRWPIKFSHFAQEVITMLGSVLVKISTFFISISRKKLDDQLSEEVTF